jgi:N-acyl-D-aspartate/D-glutamate deacylase
MDAVDRAPKGINMTTFVPINPLLVYVMGYEAAKTRDATPDERVEMARLLDEAMRAGACGWSAQRSAPGGGADVQRDYDGTPFATDLMSNETALALGEVLSRFDHAFIQSLLFTGDREADYRHYEELAEISDSAILVNAITTDDRVPEAHREDLAWVRRCRERGLKMYAQCVTSAAFFTFTLENWNLFDDSEPWREATLGTKAERLAKLADPNRRAGLKAQPPMVFPLDRLVILRTTSPKFLPAKGTLLPDAAKILGYPDQIDLFLDMVVADELQTLFQAPNFNSGLELQNELVTEPFSIWGLSDGGAHTKFSTAGSYPTESIIDYTRDRQMVTLEEAHWRLSALPAHCAGVRDRGILVEGAPADVIVYDYENLKLLDEEVAHDFPGGEWRRIRKAEGYHCILVNGEATFIDGVESGRTPGRLLRHGRG